MKKIGIMGGTFNPIHIGHLTLAQEALDQIGLDEIWFVPTGVSYQKSGIQMVAAHERYYMTALAVKENEKMRCLDMEIKREGYTYTYETLEQLVCEYPNYEFYFVIGADCLYNLENWKYPERIFRTCTIVAAVRNGSTLKEMEQTISQLQEKYGARIRLLSFLNLEISSTNLRDRIKKGYSVRYLIPDSVIAYIQEKNFYRQ